MPLSRLAHVQRRAKPYQPLAGLRVLVIDDDYDTLGVIGQILQDAGAETLEVESVRDALASIESFAPHVVVTDLAMPVLSGVALVRALRGRRDTYTRVPIIALTAYPDRFRPALAESEFDAFYTKPIEPEVLVDAVTRLVGSSRRPRR